MSWEHWRLLQRQSLYAEEMTWKRWTVPMPLTPGGTSQQGPWYFGGYLADQFAEHDREVEAGHVHV
jgi:hypothetical protein